MQIPSMSLVLLEVAVQVPPEAQVPTRVSQKLAQVVLVPPKTFRTTPSGKLMRLDARRRFLDGEFSRPVDFQEGL